MLWETWVGGTSSHTWNFSLQAPLSLHALLWPWTPKPQAGISRVFVKTSPAFGRQRFHEKTRTIWSASSPMSSIFLLFCLVFAFLVSPNRCEIFWPNSNKISMSFFRLSRKKASLAQVELDEVERTPCMSCAVQERWAPCIRFWSSIWGSVLEFCSTLARRRCGIGGGHSPPACAAMQQAAALSCPTAIVWSHPTCQQGGFKVLGVSLGNPISSGNSWRARSQNTEPCWRGYWKSQTHNLRGCCYPSALLPERTSFEPFSFLSMTQRIEPFFWIWLKELNLFEHDSKNWTFFTWLKNWTFFWTRLKELNHLFEYESKNWTF